MKGGKRGKGKGREMGKENNEKEELAGSAGKSGLNRLAGDSWGSTVLCRLVEQPRSV